MDLISQKKLYINVLKYLFLAIGIMIILTICINLSQDNISQNISDETSDPVKSIVKKELSHKLSINHTIFEGLTENLLGYKIIAQHIDKLDQNNYLLKMIDANYPLDEGILNLKSLNGTFNSEKNELILNNQVTALYNGITFNSENLKFILGSKDSYSNTPIIITYKDSEIIANNFHTENSANLIQLNGNVKVRLKLDNLKQ